MKKLIFRTDDFGSAIAANLAIIDILKKTNVVKNVSCMAIGKEMEAGAEVLKEMKGIHIGMHTVLNSEWDLIKWNPASSKEKIPSLLNADGEFYQSQKEFGAASIDFEQLLIEWNAQLDLLTRYGLKVDYIDSHMMPELFVDGMLDYFNEWIASKGLLNVKDFYCNPAFGHAKWADTKEGFEQNFREWLSFIQDGAQYLYVMHPALESEETYQFYNRNIKPGVVQKERMLEHHILSSPLLEKWMEEMNIEAISFFEAEKTEFDFSSMKKMFN